MIQAEGALSPPALKTTSIFGPWDLKCQHPIQQSWQNTAVFLVVCLHLQLIMDHVIFYVFQEIRRYIAAI